tara:strand:+ start:120 stop:266 length:147 start_codon:yes stop_codon:yes gene_type:complete
MNWQTYYKDEQGRWCESVLLEDMTLAEAEDWVINCDDVYDLGYKIEEA